MNLIEKFELFEKSMEGSAGFPLAPGDL